MITALGLDELTDPVGATEHFVDAGVDITSATPDYVRHKPDESSIIAYLFTTTKGTNARGYAQWCANPTRAAEVYDKATSMRPRPTAIGDGVSRIDAHTVLYGFPNDARLRRLRWYATPRKLKRSLESLSGAEHGISGRSGVEVLRYKPERRLVAKIVLVTRDGRHTPLLLRYSAQLEAARLAITANLLLRNGVHTPTPVCRLESDRVGIDQFIEGRQLRDIIGDDRSDPELLAVALTRFHATPPPDGTAVRSPDGDLARARSGLAGLEAWQPELAHQAAMVAAGMAAARPETHGQPCLVHGDLHPKNILTHEGYDIAFVDLERVSVASPATDLGCFRAHAIGLGIRQPGWSRTAVDYADSMIDSYRRINPIDELELGWQTAIGLIDQALLVFRDLEQNWLTTSAQLLDAARAQLGGPLNTGVVR